MAKANGIEYFINMDQVGTVIGAIEEAAQVANTDRYIGKLINAAHAKVADEFDAHIIADAMASTAFNHMFEWGTAGINNGKTNRRLNPNSAEAKLWEHVLVGSGKNKSVGFKFLPSKVAVPPPTTAKTGISQKYLSKLKNKHVFWNKAAVMEAGTPVHIAPRNGGKLFIPLATTQGGATGILSNPRGFIMTEKPVTVVPGGQNVGTFTAYWERFWEGTGQEGMQAHMQEALDLHLARVQQEAQRVKGSLKPAAAGTVQKAVKRGRALGAKIMNEAATERERRRSHN
jgi:hypothetical protein